MTQFTNWENRNIRSLQQGATNTIFKYARSNDVDFLRHQRIKTLLNWAHSLLVPCNGGGMSSVAFLGVAFDQLDHLIRVWHEPIRQFVSENVYLRNCWLLNEPWWHGGDPSRHVVLDEHAEVRFSVHCRWCVYNACEWMWFYIIKPFGGLDFNLWVHVIILCLKFKWYVSFIWSILHVLHS